MLNLGRLQAFDNRKKLPFCFFPADPLIQLCVPANAGRAPGTPPSFDMREKSAAYILFNKIYELFTVVGALKVLKR